MRWPRRVCRWPGWSTSGWRPAPQAFGQALRRRWPTTGRRRGGHRVRAAAAARREERRSPPRCGRPPRRQRQTGAVDLPRLRGRAGRARGARSGSAGRRLGAVVLLAGTGGARAGPRDPLRPLASSRCRPVAAVGRHRLRRRTGVRDRRAGRRTRRPAAGTAAGAPVARLVRDRAGARGTGRRPGPGRRCRRPARLAGGVEGGRCRPAAPGRPGRDRRGLAVTRPDVARCWCSR